MYLGGALFPDAAFKKILSIGYEFETGDLAKLSLHENKTALINSDVSLRVLKEKLARRSIKVVNGNYLHVRIPIQKEGEPDIIIEPELTEEEDEETIEFLRLMMEEAPEEYEKEQAEKERRLTEAIEKKENDSYLEYFSENRKKDNPDIINFQITNDIGDNDFSMMIKETCKDLTIPKNDMFFFKTNKGKLYNLKFSENIARADLCETFSGVEFVVTYYNPVRDNPNIILDTFIDACSRIIDHMGNLKTIRGELLIQDDKKTHYVPLGVIGNERNIYHKPKTNLFYLDTYDSLNTIRLQNYGDAEFIPQMTFRCNAIDLVEIMKEILKESQSFKKGEQLIFSMRYDYICITNVEANVDKLFSKYNETAETKIDLNTDTAKILRAYLVLMYYKIYMFIINHSKILSKRDYLKDHLTFASRHPNIVIYKRIKEILKEKYNITDIEKVYAFIAEPESLAFLYEPPSQEELFIIEPDDSDYNDDGSYKYNNYAYKEDIPDYSENYGNPLFSLPSYFKYMNEKDKDWFSTSSYDVFSTTFELKNDEILLENRSFRYAIELYLRNTLPFKITKDSLTIRDMHNIVNNLYGKSIRRMMTLSRHPTKNRLTRKIVRKSTVLPEIQEKVESSQDQNIPYTPITNDPNLIQLVRTKSKRPPRSIMNGKYTRSKKPSRRV